jgi:hypothetical protein
MIPLAMFSNFSGGNMRLVLGNTGALQNKDSKGRTIGAVTTKQDATVISWEQYICRKAFGVFGHW